VILNADSYTYSYTYHKHSVHVHSHNKLLLKAASGISQGAWLRGELHKVPTLAPTEPRPKTGLTLSSRAATSIQRKWSSWKRQR